MAGAERIELSTHGFGGLFKMLIIRVVDRFLKNQETYLETYS